MTDEKNNQSLIIVKEASNHMVLTEEVCMHTLRAIAENFSVVYQRLGNEFWIQNRETSEYAPVDEKTAESIMKDFYEGKRKSTNITYSYTSSSHIGRRFSKHSLQGISRKLRHTLAKDLYYDIDMVNAHPTFLQNICKKMDFSHPILDKYILNRDVLLNTWIGTEVNQFNKQTKKTDRVPLKTKDDVKQYFLKIINGGGSSKSSCDELNQFWNEQQLFMRVFFECPDIKRFRDMAKRKTTAKLQKYGEACHINTEGTCLNLYLCEMEDSAMIHIENYLEPLKIEIGTNNFDGFLVYQRDVPQLDQFITGVEAMLRETMGFQIRLKEKVMDEGIDVSDLIKKDGKEKRRVVRHDRGATEILYGELKNNIVYSRGSHYYKVGLSWTADETIMDSAICQYAMDADLYKPVKSSIVPYSSQFSNAGHLVTLIKNSAVNHRDDGWIVGVGLKNRGKLLFSNGYYDMMTQQFIYPTHPSYDSSIVFLESVPYEWNDDLLDDSYQVSILNRFFLHQHGDIKGRFLTRILARGIAGDAMKHFAIGTGSGNTGKSFLAKTMGVCFGGYIGTFSGANLIYKPGCSQDEAQRNRWIGLLQNKRIIFSSELRMDRHALDGNMMKTLSSGGHDPIVVRGHCQNEKDVSWRALCFLLANDMGRIHPVDEPLQKRILSFSYDRQYVDKPDPNNPYQLQMDKDLEGEIMTERFKINYANVLFSAYYEWIMGGSIETVPDEIRAGSSELVGETCVVTRFLKAGFVITGKKEDYVSSATITKWIEDDKVGCSMTKFGTEMKKYLIVNNKQGVENKDKKIAGKTVKVWFGIKEDFEDEDEDEDDKKEESLMDIKMSSQTPIVNDGIVKMVNGRPWNPIIIPSVKK